MISVTPLSWHFLNSDSFIRLDEFVISGYFVPMPEQNNFIPPPEPVDSILGVRLPVFFPKRSATTVAKGYTVEDPTTLI